MKQNYLIQKKELQRRRKKIGSKSPAESNSPDMRPNPIFRFPVGKSSMRQIFRTYLHVWKGDGGKGWLMSMRHIEMSTIPFLLRRRLLVRHDKAMVGFDGILELFRNFVEACAMRGTFPGVRKHRGDNVSNNSLIYDFYL